MVHSFPSNSFNLASITFPSASAIKIILIRGRKKILYNCILSAYFGSVPLGKSLVINQDRSQNITGNSKKKIGYIINPL